MPQTNNSNSICYKLTSAYIMYPEFKDKVVLLTGIGQSGDQNMWGNGAATARVLCQNGAKIFGCDLRLPAAQHTQKRLQAEGGICDVIAADITSDEDVKAMVDAYMAKYRRIDILINNVGMSEPGGPAKMIPHV
jgi:NAD(P)-dependent dehydrogenase (short-subunit alcohol dehydrogenase family)